MIDIENDERFVASEKTDIVSIGNWTYYQNNYIKGSPAWACYFGEKYYCAIYKIDTDEYRLIIKEGDWLSKDCEIVKDYLLSSFESAQSLCVGYME
jgi:hypothetical protein